MIKALGILNVNSSLHIFNYLIKPILLYCSDFWGCLKQPKNNPIEKLYVSFCKQLLGVRKQTNTDGVLQELGLLPITFYSAKMAVRNWERIHLKKANPLLIASHAYALRKELPWETTIRNIFASNGLLDTYLYQLSNTEDNRRSIANTLFKRLIDQHNQSSMEKIRTSSKMKTLSLLKQEAGRETYLETITNPRHRQAMSKLRLSGHSLEIERGRYSKTPTEERLCKYCKSKGVDAVEDEAHFLLSCLMTRELRDKYLPRNILDDSQTSREEKMVQILTHCEIKTVAKFIYLSFQHREITLDVLDTLDSLVKNVESLVSRQNTSKEDYNPDIFFVKNVSPNGLKIVLSRVEAEM